MHIIMMLPMNSSSIITVVNPATAVPLQNFTRVWIPMMIAAIRVNMPSPVTICIGADVNDMMLDMAYFIRLNVDHFVSPWSLSMTWNSTVVVL